MTDRCKPAFASSRYSKTIVANPIGASTLEFTENGQRQYPAKTDAPPTGSWSPKASAGCQTLEAVFYLRLPHLQQVGPTLIGRL
jgi:hypothetical protein